MVFSNYNLDKNSIYISPSQIDVKSAYADSKQNEMLMIEDDGWWYEYRIRAISVILNNFFDKKEEVWDIGGGNGYTSLALTRQGWDSRMVEPSYGGCINAKKRQIPYVYCGVIQDTDDDTIAQITLLDVLEHIKDDTGFMNDVYKKLKKGGQCLIAVPAYQHLWSSEDLIDGHQRRYGKKSLKRVIRDAGLEIVYMSSYFCFLYFPILFGRCFAEKIGLLKPADKRTKRENDDIWKKQFGKQSLIVEKIIKGCENLELKLLQNRIHLPFGASIICVCKKQTR